MCSRAVAIRRAVAAAALLAATAASALAAAPDAITQAGPRSATGDAARAGAPTLLHPGNAHPAPLVSLPPRLVHLLERRLEHERLLGEFTLLREATLALVVLGLGLGLLALAWRELRRRALVIELFDVPPGLAAQGWSGTVAARRLHDALVATREHVVTSVEKRALAQAGSGAGADITIPGARVSLASLFTYLRGALGRDTYVAGEITEEGALLAVSVRVRERAAARFAGPRAALDALLQQAAEHVLLHTEPFILANARSNRGDDAGALAVLRDCVEAPDAREASNALNLWGDILFEQGDRVGAAERYDEALRRDPASHWARVNVMGALTSAGRWEEAETLVRGFIRQAPRSAAPHALLGKMFHDAADVVPAEQAGVRAVQRDRREVGGWIGRASGAVGRHDYATARHLAETALRMRRARFNEISFNARLTILCWSLIGQRHHAMAREQAERLRDSRPHYNGGWAQMGHLLLVTHEYDAALAHLRRAVRWGTRATGSSAFLARALHRAEGPRAALAWAAASLAENPRDPRLLVARGDILLDEGDPAAAIESFRQAGALTHGFPDPFEGWGRALAATGDTHAAVTRLEQAIGLAPKWAAPHLAWGDVLAAHGDTAGAIARYEQAIARDPRGALPFARWGAALERAGQAEAATEKYARARALDPANPAFRDLPAAPAPFGAAR